MLVLRTCKRKVWSGTRGTTIFHFFSFSYILKPRQIRISIISKHYVPTSRPIGKVGLKARNSSKSIFYITRTFKVLQTFHIDRTIVVTSNCTQIQWWFFQNILNSYCMFINCSKNLSTLLDNRFFLKGQRQRKNKQVISSMRLFSSRFVLCEIFLQRQRQQKKNQPRFSATDVSHLRRECKIHVGVSWQQAIRVKRCRTRGLLCLN